MNMAYTLNTLRVTILFNLVDAFQNVLLELSFARNSDLIGSLYSWVFAALILAIVYSRYFLVDSFVSLSLISVVLSFLSFLPLYLSFFLSSFVVSRVSCLGTSNGSVWGV